MSLRNIGRAVFYGSLLAYAAVRCISPIVEQNSPPLKTQFDMQMYAMQEAPKLGLLYGKDVMILHFGDPGGELGVEVNEDGYLSPVQTGSNTVPDNVQTDSSTFETLNLEWILREDEDDDQPLVLLSGNDANEYSVRSVLYQAATGKFRRQWGEDFKPAGQYLAHILWHEPMTRMYGMLGWTPETLVQKLLKIGKTNSENI